MSASTTAALTTEAARTVATGRGGQSRCICRTATTATARSGSPTGQRSRTTTTSSSAGPRRASLITPISSTARPCGGLRPGQRRTAGRATESELVGDGDLSRSVLITGGNRGIGLAIARTFQAEGHRVAVTHRDSPPPECLLGVRCDVTKPAEVDTAFAAAERAHGPIEVLVSNAGITEDVLLLRMEEDQFSRVLDTNLAGAYRVARRAVRSMLRTDWGRIVFVSSVAAVRGAPGQVNYAASKAGLAGMARAIAREFGSRNITANVVLPGFIPTDITKALPEKLRRDALTQIPVGRYGESAEVAAAVAFLASDAAGYITGAMLPVDGGLGMGH